MKIKTAYAQALALSRSRRKQILAMRLQGLRWVQIAAALGITRQRVKQIYDQGVK